MDIEDQFVIDQFNKNYISNRKNPIIIYGTGIRTETLLKHLEDSFHIVGLMDAKRTGEVLFGKKVLDYDEVAAIDDVIIVIIARNAVINVIYKRIEQFVIQNGIKVYDIEGTEIKSHSFSDCEKECFSLDKEKLLNMIDQSDIVSFDIFDTLLCRRVLRPRDVFEVAEFYNNDQGFSYAKERMKAESDLSDLDSPTVYEIYDRLAKNTGISPEDINRLLRIEVETEKKLLVRREAMCELLKLVKQKGKRVLLVSDMYFTKEILKEILKDKGILDYDELFVSCEYHKSKSSGLFDIVKAEGKSEGKWLHIGDNSFSDIEIPGRLGLNTFRVYSTTELLEQSIYSDILEKNNSLEDNIVIAQFAAEVFNDPFDGFRKNGKAFFRDEGELAKIIIAPMVFKYMMWIADKMRGAEYDLILFPSRDGYLLKRIYDRLCMQQEGKSLPESEYFYTSRRAAMVASVQTEEDIRRISDFPGETEPGLRAKKRFELQDDPCEYMSEEYIQKAFSRCKVEYDHYLQYIKKHIASGNRKIAFADFVAIGTIQEALEKIMECKLQGFYFMQRTPDTDYRRNMAVDSLYGICGDYQSGVNIYRFYYFLEMIISSPQPSLRFFEADGTPVFYPESRTKEALSTLERMHSKILEYCEELLPLFCVFQKSDVSAEVSDQILGFFSGDYSDLENGLFDEFENTDEFLERRIPEINR